MTKLSSKIKGVFYIILAAFGFSLMSMFVKLAGDLPSFQKAFFRNFIALIFIFIMMLRDKTGFVPAKKNIPDLYTGAHKTVILKITTMASVRRDWQRNNGYLVRARYPLFFCCHEKQ